MLCRAVPGKKVATLSQQSLRLMAHISNKMEYWSSVTGLTTGARYSSWKGMIIP